MVAQGRGQKNSRKQGPQRMTRENHLARSVMGLKYNLMSKIEFKQRKAVSTRTGTRDPGLVGCASCQEMCWMLLESSRELKIFRQQATAFYSHALGSQCGSLSEWLWTPVVRFSPNDLH